MDLTREACSSDASGAAFLSVAFPTAVTGLAGSRRRAANRSCHGELQAQHAEDAVHRLHGPLAAFLLDVLHRPVRQLSAWFGAVRGIANPVTAAYLQTLLLTGARPGEVLALRWDDLNAQWMSLTIRDKVEGERQVPLTPYVWHLLDALPRRNEWVFSSSRAISLDAKHIKRRERYHAARGTAAPTGDVAQVSKSGRLMDPDTAHRQACIAANLDGLTLHGLRRSFASLTEWLEVPAGVVAQIQGHKPSATAEKHYKRRPLDLLRVHHERIEAWILEQAGVPFDAKAVPPAGLRIVAAV